MISYSAIKNVADPNRSKHLLKTKIKNFNLVKEATNRFLFYSWPIETFPGLWIIHLSFEQRRSGPRAAILWSFVIGIDAHIKKRNSLERPMKCTEAISFKTIRQSWLATVPGILLATNPFVSVRFLFKTDFTNQIFTEFGQSLS